MRSFVHTTGPSRVVFGTSTLPQVRDEVERLGGCRVLLLSDGSPALRKDTERLREALGGLAVAEFDGAAMHTPVEVTERALGLLRERDVDCLVAIGGGSTTGLAKALAVRTDLPQIIVPTTYAGSEATPVLGETVDGRKVTRSSPAILPETVVYDVELTLGLPVPMSVTSGVNALAHAVEALYSPDATPVTDAMALEAVAAIARALPALHDDPSDLQARAELLQAAWLAGTCLGAVGMGLHHKLCHTLGGTFGLPHAETHTVVLAHAMAYNAPAAPEAMDRIARALGVPDAPTGIFDLIHRVGGPTSLRGLGMAEADLDRAAELATAQPYPNPREVTRDGIAHLLRNAWQGGRPHGTVPDLRPLTDEVAASFDGCANPRLKQLLTDLARTLHAYTIRNDLTPQEWQRAIDFLTEAGHITTETRQEFILLSDTLGVSSVVDALANSLNPHTTSSAILGPFYVAGPPAAEHGSDIAGGLTGTPMWADIQVTDQEGEPVAGAVVDVWQSNEDGFYDVQLPDLDGPVLRARFITDAAGRFTFWSILPSEYPIPDDGPVGRMLSAVGRHPYRAPHVHFLIDAPGHQPLITQLFARGGAYLDGAPGQRDAVFGVKDDLITDFVRRTGPTPDGRPIDGEWRLLEFTFRIARLGD
ncbi:maleylacetate reductase and hydroxyquinol 1,2-dioxygenase domain-containing protein [Streptomyces sp. ME18-1-4]|uniref:maleylacetate reductase and hydroxyquinol 1,2-dioxygenase domain-containing protein n=1 Tax=Streptomyces sp. ME18-1-4 TaxID=3028685 RepID=UPI0029A0AD53|nr:maleylacetate reductase and hydroxyquinol 1,2-dioxygenase domain-containing protein [Streptomyces sp. ME18-1-4]MDX3246719.1 maleylacetate reductase and hydroxyquinol 1,2-dioxygenase domain-containing protein [Streptomyces sp. ME18-1-4]